MNNGRVSFFELDCEFVAGRRVSDLLDSRAHEHLEQLAQPMELPPWLDELRGHRRSDRSGRPFARLLSISQNRVVAGAALAVAAAAVIGVAVRSPEHAPVVAAKGSTPALGAFIKRGSDVLIWRPGDALEPGDQIRLRLNPASFGYAVVFRRSVTATGRAEFEQLFELSLAPQTEIALPIAWRVDDEPVAERLVVVFTQSEGAGPSALLEAQAWSARSRRPAVKDPRSSDQVWVEELVLPKRGAE